MSMLLTSCTYSKNVSKTEVSPFGHPEVIACGQVDKGQKGEEPQDVWRCYNWLIVDRDKYTVDLRR